MNFRILVTPSAVLVLCTVECNAHPSLHSSFGRAKRRPMKIRHVAVLASAMLMACGAPPPRVDKPTTSASAVVTEPPAASAIDLSPVSAPANIVAQGRIQSLENSLGVASSLLGAPKDAAEQTARGLLAEFFKRQLRLEVDPMALADQIALKGSVDLMATLVEGERPDVNLAFTMPLTSLDGVKLAAGERLLEVSPGLWSLSSDRARVKCFVMASAGEIQVRLVCGLDEEDVELLGPYLVRTAAVAPASAKDLELTLDVGMVNAKYGELVRKMGPSLAGVASRKFHRGVDAYDQAIDGLFKFGAAELGGVLADVKDLRLTAVLDPAKGVKLDLGGSLAAAPSSSLVKSLVTAPSGMPALFERGPKDTASGVFFNVGDTAMASQLFAAGRGLVQGLLEAQKVGSDAERKKMLAFFDAPFGSGTSVSIFGGASKLAPAKPAKSTADKWQAGFDAIFGFYLIGVNSKPEAVGQWLESGVAAFNQPGIQKAVLATVSKDEQLGLKKVKAPKELGAGAFAFELNIGNKKDKSTGKLHFLVGPDGDSSWIAAGFDQAELIERISRAKQNKETFDKKPVNVLSSRPASLGSFITLRTFRSTLLGAALLLPPDEKSPETFLLRGAERVDATFEKLPEKGLAPSTITLGAKDGKLGFSLEMTKASLEEFRALAAIMLAPRKK